MATHDYERFWKDLKRDGARPAWYLVGPADVLKDEALQAILHQVLDPGLRDFNLDTRSAARLQPEEIGALCSTLPMMAERRVVVIRDVEAWSKKARGRTAMLSYLEQPAPETVVVLVQGAGQPEADAELSRHAATYEFGAMRREHALRWVLRRAEQEHGVTLSEEAAEHLLNALDADVSLMASELGKLAGLGDGSPLTVAHLEQMLGVRHGETAVDWRDALLADDTARAAAMLPHVLEQPGTSAVRLVSQLGTSLIGVSLARRLHDRGVRGRRLEQEIFAALKRARVFGMSYSPTARAWAELAPRWPSARIREAVRAALAADQSLKTTTISDELGILTDLVIALAPQREAA